MGDSFLLFIFSLWDMNAVSSQVYWMHFVFLANNLLLGPSRVCRFYPPIHTGRLNNKR